MFVADSHREKCYFYAVSLKFWEYSTKILCVCFKKKKISGFEIGPDLIFKKVEKTLEHFKS